ncbi:hypothetical protein [Persephonella sp.]
MLENYPRVNTVDIVLKLLEKSGIKLSIMLRAVIEGEIESYKKTVLESFDLPSVNPVPDNIVEATDTQKQEKILVITFKNPLRYVDIYDEEGNKVNKDQMMELAILDAISLIIPKENPEKAYIGIIDPKALTDIKASPVEEIINVDEDLFYNQRNQKYS